MADVSLLGLMGAGLGLGLRHGIDWDHIAAITDITGTGADDDEGVVVTGGAYGTASGAVALDAGAIATTSWHRFFLATLYALGHALVVVALGLLAIWAGAVLPDWVDPIMERLVGVTLIVLALWIFYSLWRYGRDFQLRSRWMLVFALAGRGWARLRTRVTGREHHHRGLESYGRLSAFGIGLIHGIGAETGTQALLIAGAAGATTDFDGSMMLLAFTVGLLISNSLIAIFSTVGFVSSRTRRTVYMVVGLIAGIFSLILGVMFVSGAGADLPDLQRLIDWLFGESGVEV